MKISTISYAETGAFSQIVTDYLAQDPKLKAYYNRFPTVENFAAQIEERKDFPQEKRSTLTAELERQYQHIPEVNLAVKANIKLLEKPNTFTITTGHQLNIFTGPLYFVYKIVTAINTCNVLKKAFPEYNFVPVYWMATEDHDFAEINHFNLFGKKYEWKTNQTGPVGRFNLSGMEALLKQMPEVNAIFKEAYLTQNNLADATRFIVHALFGEYGLVSIDGDAKALKQSFKEVILNDLFENRSNEAVGRVNETLAAHYKPQVHSRPINLFYIGEKGVRERLERDENGFAVVHSDLRFSEDEMRKMVEEKPEDFSPNVILRPLFQELVLPNLAYIGGGAEVAYWFQLYELFREYKVPFPILMLRNSALYIPNKSAEKLHKLKLQPADLFKDTQQLKKQLTALAGTELISLQNQHRQLEKMFTDLELLAGNVDVTLTKMVAAKAQHARKSLLVIEKKIVKAQEKKHEIVFRQADNVKDHLFPGGSLQERKDNMLTFEADNPDFIADLVKAFDPLAFAFTILEEN